MTTRTRKPQTLVQHVRVKASALVRLLQLVSALLLFATGGVNAEFKNGFDLSDSLIPAEKIMHGGPPKDGIPAIDNPKFIPADKVDFIKPKDRVIGVYRDGVAKAYPIRILNWHEVVNDSIGEHPIVVTYCPLCGTGMVFSTKTAGGRMRFGVSGLLYNSDVLLYDRPTHSLWSQILSKAIAGPLKGVSIDMLPAAHTTWRDWKRRYPKTLGLSTDTGFKRNYRQSPYLNYKKNGRLMFPVEYKNQKYRNKEMVLGVNIDGESKAYPFTELSKYAQDRFSDVIADKNITIEWSKIEQYAQILDEYGNVVPSVLSYWFAWYAFYPETKIFQANP